MTFSRKLLRFCEWSPNATLCRKPLHLRSAGGSYALISCPCLGHREPFPSSFLPNQFPSLISLFSPVTVGDQAEPPTTTRSNRHRSPFLLLFPSILPSPLFFIPFVWLLLLCWNQWSPPLLLPEPIACRHCSCQKDQCRCWL